MATLFAFGLTASASASTSAGASAVSDRSVTMILLGVGFLVFAAYGSWHRAKIG